MSFTNLLPTTHAARSASSSRPRVARSLGSIVSWIASASAAWRILPCEAMRTNCCPFSAGGKVFTTPMRLRKRPSPSQPCWTTCGSSPANNRALRLHHQSPRRCRRPRLRAVFPDAPCQIAPGFQERYWRRAPMGLGRPPPAGSRVRVRAPKRAIMPLSVDEVARFGSVFRPRATWPSWA